MDQFFRGCLCICLAIVHRLSDFLAVGVELVTILFQHAVDAFMTPFVMRTGMHDNCPVGFSIKRHGTVIGPIAGNRSIGMVVFLGQGTNINPVILEHGFTNDSAAFLVGGRQTGQKPGMAIAFGKIVLGDKG